jgi:hypothetical protein
MWFGAVLAVIVLDQGHRSVDAKIIGLPGCSSRPGKAEAPSPVPSRVASGGHEVGRERVEEAVHQRLDEAARRAVHGAELQPARLAEILLALRAGDDLAERAVGDDRVVRRCASEGRS